MPFGANPDSGGVILLSGAAMSSLDDADGETDGEILITHSRQEGTWKLGGKDFDIGQSVSAAGDVDGDGLPELVLPAYVFSEDDTADSSYIISTAELALLDIQDGKADSFIELDRIARRWSD